MNFQSNQIALIDKGKFFFIEELYLINIGRMMELDKHNFIVANEIINSNKNHQLMKFIHKRFASFTRKGSGVTLNKYRYTCTQNLIIPFFQVHYKNIYLNTNNKTIKKRN